jgi:type II restriction enzyme
MDLNFESVRADAYISGLQRARVLTEHWVAGQIYCPNCGNIQINRYHNNNPVGDFHCSVCKEEYELKSQRARFGAKVVDGAYGSRQRSAPAAARAAPDQHFAQARSAT